MQVFDHTWIRTSVHAPACGTTHQSFSLTPLVIWELISCTTEKSCVSKTYITNLEELHALYSIRVSLYFTHTYPNYEYKICCLVQSAHLVEMRNSYVLTYHCQVCLMYVPVALCPWRIYYKRENRNGTFKLNAVGSFYIYTTLVFNTNIFGGHLLQYLLCL